MMVLIRTCLGRCLAIGAVLLSVERKPSAVRRGAERVALGQREGVADRVNHESKWVFIGCQGKPGRIRRPAEGRNPAATDPEIAFRQIWSGHRRQPSVQGKDRVYSNSR